MTLDTARMIRHHFLLAAIVGLGVGGAAVFWSVAAPLEGAVVAPGTVVVEGNVKKVQHPTGGIIGEIRMREGDKVVAGDVLLRLDETVTRANLAIINNELVAARARLARLQAFRDGRQTPLFPADLEQAARSDPALRAVLEGEARLCDYRLRTRDEERQQHHERIKQLREEIKGMEEQQKSLEGQMAIAQTELADLMPLYQAGGVPRTRITTLEREVLRQQGLIGETRAKIAEAQAKISETELKIVESDHEFISNVIKELRETETKIGELSERRVTAEDQLKRLDILAPISGYVHQLAVHTVGGVISPSETLMLIVPSQDRLIVEVRVSPSDIDQLSPGQEARVRFSAFNRRTTEEVNGTLFRLAADLTLDPQTQQSYYLAAVSIPENELAKLGSLRLLPGMPAEVFVKTGERTLASYLVQPIADQMARAFRER